MTTEQQKSVNQLVQEAVNLVAAATKSADAALETATITAVYVRVYNPDHNAAIHETRRVQDAALAASVAALKAQSALQRLERHLAQTVPEPKQSDDGWIEWAGGDCPVAEDAVVDLRFRSGQQRTFKNPYVCRWWRGSEPRQYDIVAYRIHKADPAPQDDGWIEWAGGDCPVAKGVKVDIRARNGRIRESATAGSWMWLHSIHHLFKPFDIVAYRIHKPATLAEAEAEIERLRAEVETQKREHEGLREWSADQADQILELIDAHNEAAAQYNEAQAECEALKRENAERKLSELQAAHEALQQAHQDAVQQLASRNNEIANLRKFIG